MSNEMLNEMYPTMTPPPEPEPHPGPIRKEDLLTVEDARHLAQGLFPKQEITEMRKAIPANIQRLRAEDRGLQSYPNSNFYGSLGLEQKLVEDGTHPALAKEIAMESGRMLSDLGVSGVEATELVRLISSAKREPVSEGQFNKWKGETHKSATDREISLAHALLARDKRLHDIITSSNLHWHPAVVRMLHAAALQQKIKGRL